MQRIFTESKPNRSLLKVQKDTIRLCNETHEVIQLMIAPDPNQVVLMKLGGKIGAGIDGAGISCTATRGYVPRDTRTSKKFLPPGAMEKLRLPSPKVFVTVVSNDSLKEWDRDIVMMKGDTLRVYVSSSNTLRDLARAPKSW